MAPVTQIGHAILRSTDVGAYVADALEELLHYVMWMDNPPGGDPDHVLEGLHAGTLIASRLLERVEDGTLLLRRLRGDTWDDIGASYGLTGPVARERFQLRVEVTREALGAAAGH
jgi:hypothetical protein